MTALLATEGLGRTLSGTPPVVLVSGVALTIEPGTFTAIVGPSGCGKSSLLYLLGLIDRPTAGRVLLEGRDTSLLDGDARARLRLRHFGFVFQFHFLLPEFTALENVLIPLRRLGSFDEEAAQARAWALLDQFGLAGKAERRPDHISGGERQRVAVARALANDPRIVLADEPTGNLDSRNSQAVVEYFRELAHVEHRAVVCVTHDPAIARLADRRIEMLDGRIVADEA